MAPKRLFNSRSKKRPSPNLATTETVNPFEQRWVQSHAAAAKRQARNSALTSNSNKFIDKRIAEHDPSVTDADRYLLRLQRERSNQHKRASQFNLESHDDYDDTNGEDGLDNSAPYNQNLLTGNEENLENVDTDDEDDLFSRKKPRLEDGAGHVEVETAYFNEEKNGEDRPKSKQEVMHELIQKSKAHKAEKQREKHHVALETVRLDTGLQDIMELLNKAESDFDAATEAKKSRDKLESSDGGPLVSKDAFQYDAAYNMLAQEKRARPSQRLLTDEERAEREKERLVELERLRQQRVDSLDDYASNKAMNEELRVPRAGADDIADSFLDATDGNDNSESDSDEDEDHLKKGSSDQTAEIQDEVPVRSPVWSGPAFWESFSEAQVIASETDEREIPFLFNKCPATVKDLQRCFENTTVSQRAITVDRLRKCFALSLDPGRNRGKLESLTECLLFWIERLCEVSVDALSIAMKEVDVLLVHVHALGSIFERTVSGWARTILIIASRNLERPRSTLSEAWSISEVLLLRCISRIFPSSDLRHGIMTPLSLLLSESLSSTRICGLADVSIGVFVANILLDGLGARKGYSPEFAQFICDVLTACSKGSSDTERNDLGHVFDNVPISGSFEPFSLSDCKQLCEGDTKGSDTENLLGKVLNSVLALMEAAFDSWVPHADIVLSQVTARHVNPEWIRKRVEAVLDKCKTNRKPLALYTKRERVIVKTVNPRMRSSESGVFHKRGRSVPGIAPTIDEAAAAAKRVRKALRKEIRGMARDVRQEADAAAGQVFAKDAQRRQKADAKDKQIRAFFEHQRSTWRAAEKKQNKLSKKKW